MFDEALLDQLPFFRAVGGDDRVRLLASAELGEHGRGDRIWDQGDASASFHFVVAGSVKLVKASDAGRETIIEVGRRGDLLCGCAPCTFTPFCCRAIALEGRTRVLELPRRDVLGLVERSPVAADAFRHELTGRVSTLCRRVDELASGAVERRITRLLTRLGEEVGVDRDRDGGGATESGRWVPVALTRQDLADMCGTTIETASRVMTRLARQGVVLTRPGGFLILDGAALAEIARRR